MIFKKLFFFVGLFFLPSIFSMEDEGKNMSLRAPCGLANLGNSCFMNAALQCLNNLKGATKEFSSYKFDLNKEPLLYHLTELIKNMNSSHKILSPQALCNQVREKFFFQEEGQEENGEWEQLPKELNQKQEDSAEFLEKLLTELFETQLVYHGIKQDTETDWFRIPGQDDDKYWNFVKKHPFSTVIDAQRKCCNCTTVTSQKETLRLIPCEVPAHCTSLHQCLNDFLTDEEILAKCEKCCSKKESIKGVRLSVLPERLIVQAKIFSHDGRKSKKKLDSIPFPLDNLSLVTEINKKKNYTTFNLTSLVLHSGKTLESGHYVALVKRPDGQWYLCNDSTITPFSTEDIEKVSKQGIYEKDLQSTKRATRASQEKFNPYLWFYEKNNLDSDIQNNTDNCPLEVIEEKHADKKTEAEFNAAEALDLLSERGVARSDNNKTEAELNAAQALVKIASQPIAEKNNDNAVKSNNDNTLEYISAQKQPNGWECGYRAVYNAWLIMENNFSHEGIDFQAPKTSFEEWIERMKQRWLTIFGKSRPFMNGKWEKDGAVLAGWKFETMLDSRSLFTKDVELLTLLVCASEDNQRACVQDFVKKHEKSRADFASMVSPYISIVQHIDYVQQDNAWWPKEKYIRYNIAHFKYDSKPQLVIMHEGVHWTTMLITPGNSRPVVIDSLPRLERLINTIVYSMFVTQSFPTRNDHDNIFKRVKTIKASLLKEPYNQVGFFKFGCIGLYRHAQRIGFIEPFITSVFKEKNLPLPEMCKDKAFEFNPIFKNTGEYPVVTIESSEEELTAQAPKFVEETEPAQETELIKKTELVQEAESVKEIESAQAVEPVQDVKKDIVSDSVNSVSEPIFEHFFEISENLELKNLFDIIPEKQTEDKDQFVLKNSSPVLTHVVNDNNDLEARQDNDNLLFLKRIADFLKPEVVDYLREKGCVELREISLLNGEEIISRVVVIENLGMPQESIHFFFNTGLYATETFFNTYMNDIVKKSLVINKVVIACTGSAGKEAYMHHDFKNMLSLNCKEFEDCIDSIKYLLNDFFGKETLIKKMSSNNESKHIPLKHDEEISLQDSQNEEHLENNDNHNTTTTKNIEESLDDSFERMNA